MFKTPPRNPKPWHKKAKWMLKKVIINPPKNPHQMTQLCNSLVSLRHGANSESAAVVTTALQLWQDENLVRALHNNPAFQIAKERIQNLSGHILPPQNTRGNDASNPGTSESDFMNANWSNQIIRDTFERVFLCPGCGKSVECTPFGHEHHSNSACLSATSTSTPLFPTSSNGNSSAEESLANNTTTTTNVEEIDDDTADLFEGNFSEGTAGKVPSSGNQQQSSPNNTDDPYNPSAAEASGGSPRSTFLSYWFGPLVLASLAVFGLAFGILNGEINVPHVSTLSSRALAALTMIVQASDSVFKFLRH